jgi:hypothetical protein
MTADADNSAAGGNRQDLGDPPPGHAVPTADEADVFAKQRAKRNLAVAGALIGFVVLIFLVTLVRLSGNIAQLADRPL